MKLFYVAGPFSAPDRSGVDQNIGRAEAVGLALAREGLFPVVPHANSSDPGYEYLQPYQFWIDGTMELLKRCDAVVTVPGWENSKGAVGEVEEALRRGMPVFHKIAHAVEWERG